MMGNELFDSYFDGVEKCLAELRRLKEKWEDGEGDASSSGNTSWMKEIVDAMDLEITEGSENLRSVRIELHQMANKQKQKEFKQKISSASKEVKVFTRFLKTTKGKMNRALMKVGDRAGFSGKEREIEDDMHGAIDDLDDGNEMAGASYEELRKQKETMLGYSSHLGNITTSLALSERYLRIMMDRDKKNQCIVTFMILCMFLVIISAGIGIFQS